MVVCGPVRGKDRVAACSQSARRLGITVGMLRVDAEALAGRGVRFEADDPAADARQLRRLAAVGQQFSPTVAVQPGESPEALFLDATGCEWAFGGDAGFAAAAVGALRERGYWAVAAVADTVGAAWAVARYGTGRRLFVAEVRARVLVVPPGQQRDALRPLPIEALRLAPRVVEVLHELNVARVGQLLALPRDQLPSRFGTELLATLDRALGGIPEGLRPEPLVEPLEARWAFEPPVADAQVLLAVMEKLLGRLLATLRGRDLGFQKVLWWPRTDQRDPVCRSVDLLRPTASVVDLVELIRLQLDRLTLRGEVTDVTVRAVAAPLVYRHRDLFGGRVGPGQDNEVSGLIERLGSRLGGAAVLRPRLVADPQPERAFEYEPWLGAPARPSGERTPVGSTRPPVLRNPPEPVRVLPAGGGPPGWVQWKDRECTVERTWGPERVETGWWRGADVRRDYFVVETTDGERLWLFRDLATREWFLHGVFA